MSVRELTFDDAPPEQSAATRPYRATESLVDRLSIIFFQLDKEGRPDLTRPRVQAARTQYHTSLGTVLSRKGEEGADDEVWDQFEPPRDRYATLVLKYPTEPSGKVLQDPSGIAILPWDFGEPTYRRLHDLTVQQRPLGRNLGSIDLKIECTNSRKQYVKASVAGAAIWRMKPEAMEKFLNRALPLYDSVRIGRDIPESELRRLLGLPAVAPSVAADAFEIDDDLLNQV